MIAICFKGSRVVSWGVNKKKTEPYSSTIDYNYRYEEGDGRSSSCNRHAEIDAIKKYQYKQIDLIVIMRMNKNGDVSKSKPCSMCMQYILDNNISKIIYANWDGDYVKIKNK
jgi:deoxycytidylate deaminase